MDEGGLRVEELDKKWLSDDHRACAAVVGVVLSSNAFAHV